MFRLLVALCLTFEQTTAQAAEHSWADVMNLKTGTTLGLMSNLGQPGEPMRHYVCRVLKISAEGLECAVIQRDREWLQEFDRRTISEIHFESVLYQNSHRAVWIGATIVGALFAIGFASEGAGPAASSVYGLYGAGIGALIGYHHRSPKTVKTRHGAVVYHLAPSAIDLHR